MPKKLLLPAAFSFALFGGYAFFGPYIVIYYQGLGFSGPQIGLLTGLSPLITLLAGPFWTGLADTRHAHRRIVALCLAVGIAVLAYFPLLRGFLPVLLVSVLFSIFFAPISSFSDSAAMHMLGERKELYGRIRLGGTIGFGLAAPIAGLLVEQYEVRAAFWGGAALFLVGLLISTRLSFSGNEADGVRKKTDFRVFLRTPGWGIFIVLAVIGGTSLAANVSYFFPYMREIGMAESQMGIALTLGTVAEIPIFFFGDRLLKRIPAFRLLIVALLLTGFRLVLFGVTTTPAIVLFLQLVNGGTFPMLWLAGVSYAEQMAPPGLKSTSQGIFGAMVFGFGNAIGGVAGGNLLASIGGGGLNLVFGIAIITATLIVIAPGVLRRRRAQQTT